MTNTLLTLHDPEAARRYYAEGLWRADTLYTLLQQHAARRPDAHALRDGTQRLTWARLLKLVDAVAADLDAAGLKRGERVAVWLPSRVESVAVQLACSRNGYVCNPSLHQNYTVAEIVALLARTRAAALFAQPGYGADAGTTEHLHGRRRTAEPSPGLFARRRRAGRGAPSPTRTVPGHCRRSIRTRTRSSISPSPRAPPARPKGVMHSDNTLLANGRAMVKDWHHDEHTDPLEPQPDEPSHRHRRDRADDGGRARTGGQRAAPRHDAARLDHRDRRDLCDGRADPCDGHPRATCGSAGSTALGAVKVFYMAGSPIPREVAKAFLDRGIMPQNVYGMTENGSHQYTLPSDDAGHHRRDLRAGLRRLRDPHLGPGQPRYRGGARRGRRDRRARRLPDARLFRQPGGDRGFVQPGGLVHVAAISAGSTTKAASKSSAARRI